jgi:negative regulator of flagellin synthesis FlgM
MSRIDSRSSFFPNSKSGQSAKLNKSQKAAMQRNSYDKAKELNAKTSDHAKVAIPEAVKDFARIKRAVDTAPEIDNSAKMARLKSQIKNGTYNVDYDAVADKILQKEY